MLCQWGFCAAGAARRGAGRWAGERTASAGRVKGEQSSACHCAASSMACGQFCRVRRSFPARKSPSQQSSAASGRQSAGLRAPIAPVPAAAHKAVHGDECPFAGRLRQGRAGGVRKTPELVYKKLRAGRVKGIVPDAGGKVRCVQQGVRFGGETAGHLAGCVVAQLPALAEQLEVEVAAAHGGIEDPCAAGCVPAQFNVGIRAAKVLHLYAQNQREIALLCGHDLVHLLKITIGIHSGSPSSYNH